MLSSIPGGMDKYATWAFAVNALLVTALLTIESASAWKPTHWYKCDIKQPIKTDHRRDAPEQVVKLGEVPSPETLKMNNLQDNGHCTNNINFNNDAPLLQISTNQLNKRYYNHYNNKKMVLIR